jgi:hypothetical protein
MPILILFILLTTTPIAFATPCDANGVLCATLKLEKGEGEVKPTKICVLSSDGFEPVWYLLGNTSFPDRLEKVPDSMLLVTEILLSPSQKFLAIASVGEGHPYITVVELAPLLHKELAKTLVAVNPYPSSANIIGWEGKADKERLVIESDRLLSEQNQDLFKNQKFAVEANTGKIRAVSPELQLAIPYYVKLLQQSDKPSDEIVETLASLARGEKRLLLKQALERETKPAVRDKLAKAMERAVQMEKQ